MYQGESADYLEDVSWEKDGFLPFGDESEAENLEFFSDRRGLEDSGRYEKMDLYHPLKQNDGVRAAAAKLKRQLEKCLLDVELSELTARLMPNRKGPRSPYYRYTNIFTDFR